MRALLIRAFLILLLAGLAPAASANPDPEPADESDVSPDYLGKSEIGIERPTFDCAKAAWPQLGAIICASSDAQSADWELAGAYWALYFSRFGQDRAAFRNDHVDWAESLALECGRQPTKATASGCVARAYRARATTYRSELTGDALAEAQSTPAMRLQIQEALVRQGHLNGGADGVLGGASRAAIVDFQRSLGENTTGFLTAAQRRQLGVFSSQEEQNEYEAEDDQPSSNIGKNGDTAGQSAYRSSEIILTTSRSWFINRNEEDKIYKTLDDGNGTIGTMRIICSEDKSSRYFASAAIKMQRPVFLNTTGNIYNSNNSKHVAAAAFQEHVFFVPRNDEILLDIVNSNSFNYVDNNKKKIFSVVSYPSLSAVTDDMDPAFVEVPNADEFIASCIARNMNVEPRPVIPSNPEISEDPIRSERPVTETELSCSNPTTASALNRILRRQLDGQVMLMSGNSMYANERAITLERIEYTLSNVRTRSSSAPLDCAAELLLKRPSADGLSRVNANALSVIFDLLRATGRTSLNITYTVEKTDDGHAWVEIKN